MLFKNAIIKPLLLFFYRNTLSKWNCSLFLGRPAHSDVRRSRVHVQWSWRVLDGETIIIIHRVWAAGANRSGVEQYETAEWRRNCVQRRCRPCVVRRIKHDRLYGTSSRRDAAWQNIRYAYWGLKHTQTRLINVHTRARAPQVIFTRATICVELVLATATSIRPSVCYNRYCIKTETASVMISSPSDSPMISASGKVSSGTHQKKYTYIHTFIHHSGRHKER